MMTSGDTIDPETVDTDAVDRVVKLVVDAGDAETFEEAAALLRTYRLQLIVGADAAGDQAWQAGLLTAVNTGMRAVHGGVTVVLAADAPLAAPTAAIKLISEALQGLGATIAREPAHGVPSIGFGADVTAHADAGAVHPFAGEWIAGVSPTPVEHDATSVLAAVMASAMAVSECFQRLRGYPVAADRRVGVSIWDPQADWRSDAAEGPAISELPGGAWLLGLGHLGQAYAWLLHLLPYTDQALRQVVLQDADRLSAANRATSMLHTTQRVGMPKTRLVADALEAHQWQTTLVERRYGGGQLYAPGDPTVLLAGVDNPDTRRLLDQTGFPVIYDAGLGAGPDGYLGMTVRRLPASRPARDLWPPVATRGRDPRADAPAYRALEERTGDRCGVELLAQRTVATAFVGVVAAAWAIGGLLRELHGGARYELVDYSLRTPGEVAAIPAPGGRPARVATVAAIARAR